MKKLFVVGLAILALFAGLMVAIFSALTTVEVDECFNTTNVDVIATTPSTGITVKGVRISPEQMQNAATITMVAVEYDFPVRAAEIAIMTAIQESVLENLPYGYPGTSAIGLFSQQDAWGPRSVRMDPDQSTEMFFTGGRAGQRGLIDVQNWQNLERGQAAQSVQGSNPTGARDPAEIFREGSKEYQQHEAEALSIVAAIMGDETVLQASQECEKTGDPIEEMVQAALSRVDQPLDSITTAGSARIATYNVLGSNHTSTESAMNRIETSAALIQEQRLGVVGLQELRPDQRSRLLQLLGASYDIYPKTPVYGDSQLSVNSIIWDTSQFEFVSGRTTPMPFYFGGQRLDIPLVELRNIATDKVITVINTHDPAKRVNDRLRYLNAFAHAELADTLTAGGATVFFTGDFNSGYGVRSTNNTTYLNQRDNLTWCIMTKSGVLVNGYDDFRGRSGCPTKTTEEMGVGPVDHVYVPRDGVVTTDYKILTENTASDHPVVYAEVAFDTSLKPVTSEIETSAEFVSWAAGQAEIELPSELASLETYTAGENSSLTSQIIRGSNFVTGEDVLQRGDIVFTSKNNLDESDDVSISLGSTGANTITPQSNTEKSGKNTDSPSSDTTWLSASVGRRGKTVKVFDIDIRRIVQVLRLSVENPLLNSSGGWVFPLQAGTYTYNVDSYGPRDLGSSDFNNGTDFGTNGATPPLFALQSGEIVRWGYEGAWGNQLVVETGIPVPGMEGETYKYLYAHMSSYASGLSSGDTVRAGQLVGNVGNTGNSFGEHLHLTICTTMECTSGNAAGSTDPIPFLASVGIRP